MIGARVAVGAAALVLGATAGCGDDDAGTARAEVAVAALAESPEADAAFAEAIDAIADEGADAETAQGLADALPLHVEYLTDLGRPEVIRALAAVFLHEGPRATAVDAFTAHVVASVEPLIDGTATEAETEQLLRDEIVPLVGAARAAAERSGALSGGALERSITETARRILATRVADRDGLGPVEAGDYAETLSSAWPSGDPIEVVDRWATEEATQRDDDDPW